MSLPRPSRWPVRWRLAIASAGLTLVILLVFAGVVGSLAGERVRDDFNRDLENAASGIAARTQILSTPLGGYIYQGPVLNSVAAANGATIRVIALDGTPLRETPGADALGPPGAQSITGSELRVVTAAILNEGQTVGYVQYGRSEEQIESTIARIWLFIAAGVVGGTLLASIAGLAIADRAMRPVAALTSRAREIATTRDPSIEMPSPASDDEVGELTETLSQMLRALEDAQSEREAAMQRQKEFVADASHELRTPLTSVLANLELLQESLAQASGDDPEMIASALRSSRRMNRLVGDLLLLARADAGRRSPRASCDLAEIARDAAAEVTPVLGGRELIVGDMPPAPVEGSTDELHRLVLNLLDNAIHHTPPGSTIEICIEPDAGDRHLLVVSDDGPGVPPELRDQVFDRFARGGTSADTSKGGGTGLGLAIVRSVAGSHGGTVSIGDSASGGARFEVRLPASASAESGDPVNV